MLRNMIKGGFPGRIYPVNPRENEILSLKVYRNLADLPETPDLVVIVVPSRNVVPVVKECISRGVRAGIIITAGFAELGEEGRGLQHELVRTARDGGMILVGPNCNGIANPWEKLHVQFPPFYVPPGPIGIVAQSGNVLDALSWQIMVRGFGCSTCVSSGNEADLHSEDYIEYLGLDPHTKVILCYIEGFKDGDRFFRVVRQVSRQKPVVVLKVGNTVDGARAAMSHTASIAGSDAVFDAVCRQSGAIRAKNPDDLLNIGIGFLSQPLPQGRRVGIVTAGGGWGVLAADACAENGLTVVPLPEETIGALDSFLPVWWNRGNPVDLVAGAFGDATFNAVELLLRCSVVDGTVVTTIIPALGEKWLLASPDNEDRDRCETELIEAVCQVLERFKEMAMRYGKPVVVASEMMFGDSVLEAKIRYAMGQKNVVCYHMPHEAATVMAALARYKDGVS